MAKLEVTYAGRWYFGLTALLGGVCAISSNNVIYLIESILLASMLVSIFAAYRSACGVTVEYRRSPAISEASCTDQFKIANRAGTPRFCLEIGEWRGGKFVPLGFAPHVPGGGCLHVPCRRIFPKRGRHEWDGLAVASRYPFGLFRFVHVLRTPGSRLIWPARAACGAAGQDDAGLLSSVRAGIAVVEGEIRPMTPDDDWRSVVWTLSARGGDPVVRSRGAEQQDPAVILDMRGVRDRLDLEARVSTAASAFYPAQAGKSPDPSRGGTLILIDTEGRRRIQGTGAALDHLALVGLSDADRARKFAA